MSRHSERSDIPESQRIRLLEYDADRIEVAVQKVSTDVAESRKAVEQIGDDVDKKLNAFQSSMTKTVIGLLGGVIVALTIQLILAFSQGP